MSYLVASWEAIAFAKGQALRETPVEWTDVHVHRPVLVGAGDKCTLATLLDASGGFQVTTLNMYSFIHPGLTLYCLLSGLRCPYTAQSTSGLVANAP
jgi:hypothetical protein